MAEYGKNPTFEICLMSVDYRREVLHNVFSTLTKRDT
jgi:hypothetical protein